MSLEELYEYKLGEYKLTGKREQLDKLLALKLLPIKEQFEGLKVCEGEFYNCYKEIIDSYIKVIESDFEVTREVIEEIIEENGVCSDDYEEDHIWFIYAEGFGSMHWGMMYHPEYSPEEVYRQCFDNELDLISKDDLKLRKEEVKKLGLVNR